MPRVPSRGQPRHSSFFRTLFFVNTFGFAIRKSKVSDQRTHIVAGVLPGRRPLGAVHYGVVRGPQEWVRRQGWGGTPGGCQERSALLHALGGGGVLDALKQYDAADAKHLRSDGQNMLG